MGIFMGRTAPNSLDFGPLVATQAAFHFCNLEGPSELTSGWRTRRGGVLIGSDKGDKANKKGSGA